MLNSLLESEWLVFWQALTGLLGTWLLAFGLKSIRETGTFDTAKPHPLSWRFWIGLTLLTLAALPYLAAPLTHRSPSPRGTGSAAERTLVCRDSRPGAVSESPWVLRLEEAAGFADMVVHVPSDSARLGVPAGNRRGRLRVTERAYEIVIPGDGGGQGEGAWARLAFSFEIDRYSGDGTLQIGEPKHGERAVTPLRCEPGPQAPRL